MRSAEEYLRPEVPGRVARFDLKAKFLIEASSPACTGALQGFSVEFSDHRKYVPGDDLKDLDWRVFARINKFYIKARPWTRGVAGHVARQQASSAGQRVELVIDGESRDSKPASAHKVEQMALVAMATKASAEHWRRMSLSGQDNPPIDNSAYFSFRTSAAMRVVLVNGAPATVPRRDELFFLRIALPPPGTPGEQVFQVSEIRPGDLDAAEVGDADVIVLANIAGLSAPAWTKVRNFVSTGRGLMVFGDDHLNPGAYEPMAKDDVGLLPCTIGAQVPPPKPLRLEPGKLEHPILRPFQGGRHGNLAAAEFSTYHKLAPNPKVPHEIVISFRNGDPALIVGRCGAGRVMVFASTCDMDWNTLSREVPNPVFIQEAFKFLATTQHESRNIRVGASPAIRVPSPATVRALRLALPGRQVGGRHGRARLRGRPCPHAGRGTRRLPPRNRPHHWQGH